MTFTFYCSCCCLDCIGGKHCGGTENDHGICMWPVEEDAEEDIYDDCDYFPLFEREAVMSDARRAMLYAMDTNDLIDRIELLEDISKDLRSKTNRYEQALRDIATNANGAEYGLWANRKAEKALGGGE